MAEDIWKKIVSNIIPIILAALFSVIGFIIVQLFLLNSNINEFKLEELRHYMEMEQKFEVQKVTVGVLRDRLDRMDHSGGLSYEDFSEVDFFGYRDNSNLHPLGLLGARKQGDF